jgi:hypothetical protein
MGWRSWAVYLSKLILRNAVFAPMAHPVLSSLSGGIMQETFDSGVFNLAPIAMWIEDFSDVKALFDIWRSQGITDIRAFLAG